MSDCGDVKKVFVKPDNSASTESETNEKIIGIKIEPSAADKIKQFLIQDNKSPDEFGLFVKVVKDGCSGNSYIMDLKPLEGAKENGDKIFEKNGAYLVIEKTSYFFVAGSILSYKEALTGSGFSLDNPNIKRSCSCGSSFAV